MASVSKISFSFPITPIAINNNSNFNAPSSLPMIPRCNVVKENSSISTPLQNFDYNYGHPSITETYRIEHENKLEEFKRIFREISEDPLQGVFNKFKDREGSFRYELCRDVKGLIELYEASQLGIDGEHILDEAGEFSSGALKKWQITEVDLFTSKILKDTLEQPFHKSLSRLTAGNLLRSDFQGTNEWINSLQEVAKMDFNLAQSLYQNEIAHISNWWKQLGLAKELEFVRDQPLKWYMWSMACLTDPNLSEQRIDVTKAISLIYIIDDIFDVYGTLDELTLFVQAVERWDYAEIHGLPDCMKICFKALDDITNEISQKVYKQHGRNPINSLRKAWITLFRAFLVEAQWFGSGKLPKAKDYLENGIVSSGVHIVLVHIFFLLGLGLTHQNVEFIDNNPSIISATATILRLWDDFGSAQNENQDGHDGSYVECYMQENQGVEVESVRQEVIDMISNAWKVLNKQCLSRESFSMTFCKASLNIARMVPLMYSYDENQCLPSLKEYMKSLLYQSVPMKTLL